MIDVAREVAEEAGALLMERFGRLTGGEITRYGRRDMVTAADREAEDHLRRRLLQAFPGHRILAEEAERHTPTREADAAKGPVWILDPLDGTVNFVQGIPYFCVSVGFVEDGQPVLGVVHAPALGQTIWGAPGTGCFDGERPVSVSATPLLEEAVVATGFAYNREHLADDNLDNFRKIGMRVRGMRRLGAAALDLAYVASGRLDAFWELHLSPWDVAAGAALIRAAGGRVTDQRGGDRWLFGRNVVATNGLLHEDLRASLEPLRGL
jgi:myo-inositol-1(or 4)-monophosphatase